MSLEPESALCSPREWPQGFSVGCVAANPLALMLVKNLPDLNHCLVLWRKTFRGVKEMPAGNRGISYDSHIYTFTHIYLFVPRSTCFLEMCVCFFFPASSQRTERKVIPATCICFECITALYCICIAGLYKS